MGFTKLDSGIVNSSIWSEDPYTRVVWITLLAMKNQHGIVESSKSGLLRACNVPAEKFEDALKILSSPDNDSKDTSNDGIRIKKIEGGWLIINSQKYRDKTYKSSDINNGVLDKRGYVYFAKSGDKIKIGYSLNPWARITELKTACPDIAIVHTIRGTKSDEGSFHLKYSHLRLSGEWFDFTGDLMEFLGIVVKNEDVVATTSLLQSGIN